MTMLGLHPLLTEMDRIEIRIAALNDCAPETASSQFRRCCGSSRWVEQMTKARPFSDIAGLQACADRIWASCSREDWLEAFAAHPKIGDQSGTRWSKQEQSGAAIASPMILAALAKGNQDYQAKFGYTFIVCATGRSAAEMLAVLEQRLGNNDDSEIHNAAEQQRLIMHLRLRKLLSE